MTGTGGAPDEEALLDEGFDAATLHRLRDRMATCAVTVGVAASRVPDIVLAVHELAANAIRHGAGAGRLLVRATPSGALSCQVSDTGPGPGTWPVQPGHGLWIVREVADQMTVSSSPDGFLVTAVFSVLPGAGIPRRRPCPGAAASLRATVALVDRHREGLVPYIVDFDNVSAVGLESSPVASALAGLRANEARYFKNKYGHVFTVSPAGEAPEALDLVTRVLADERKLVISARPLEVTSFEVDGIRMAYVFYESGLSVNVMYTIADRGKRAVGFKLSEGMEVPEELAAAGFKFARQKSKLAGVIRGSFFVIKGEY